MTKMTADQILEAMDEMEYEERIKLLKALAVKHFGRKPKTVEEIAKLNYQAMYGDDNNEVY